VRRAVYSASQCAPDEFLRNFSIWCFRLELIKVTAKIKDFIPVLSRSSWFVFGAQEVMFRAKQNEPSAGGWDSVCATCLAMGQRAFGGPLCREHFPRANGKPIRTSGRDCRASLRYSPILICFRYAAFDKVSLGSLRDWVARLLQYIGHRCALPRASPAWETLGANQSRPSGQSIRMKSCDIDMHKVQTMNTAEV